MAKKEIIKIYERYKERMEDYHAPMDVTDIDIEKFLEFFNSAGASEDETLLYYTTYLDDDNEKDLAVAITDEALYYSFRLNYLDLDVVMRKGWRLRGIERIKVQRYGDITFYLDIDPEIQGPIKIAASDFFDKNMLENSDDMQLFVNMISEMCHADKKAGQREEEAERVRKQEEEAERLRKQEEEAEKLRKQKQEEERLRKQKEEERLRKQKEEEILRMKKAEEEKWHKYEVDVTKKNIGEILVAGKSTSGSGIDVSVISKLDEKELALDKKKREAKRPSKLGDKATIQKLKLALLNGKKELALLQDKLVAARKEWETSAFQLFTAATNVNTRIEIGSTGYNISKGGRTEKTFPGVYTTPVPVAGKRNVDHLPADVAEDIKKKADALSKIWSKYLAQNAEVWKKVEEITGEKSFSQYSTADAVVEGKMASLQSEIEIALKYEAWDKEIKNLESEVEVLRRKKDEMMAQLNNIDPILSGFSLPADKDIYTQEWINNVKRVAETRKSMPYLPLYWSDNSFGTVFNWQKAIEDGKPNLFIEAATDEGDYGRVDMLDNFITTMLLAFPVKDLHFTVIEQNRTNQFVKGLPKKLCDCYSVDGDSEAINLAANRLGELLSSDRGSNTRPPREIVVFVGFRKRDQKLAQIMDRFREPIKKGKAAGIYFAIVLDEDITKYDWKDADANSFEEFFTSYSTILTNKKDKDGNPIPDYDLLKNKAEYVKEEKLEKGTLADLVTAYLTDESSTIPNKVYDLIENGKMYSDKLITNLDDQPRQDMGKLVIPLADNGEGKEIDMLLDDKEYMFYFILGMTGSGKSFTLHTILTNLMLKYDPSLLDVVIMDFKGGVEMADYRGVPHVSSILANGADAQVAGEMLMSLNKEMTRRDELFTKSGTKNISDYNRYALKNGLEQMKNVIFLVDECQDLFKIDRPINSSEFIAMLAKKGRIYGIHMILATQTLKNSGIPRDALSQFSDFIFMKCAPDDVATCGITDKDLQKSVATLNMGEMYYCHGQSEPVHGFVYNYAGKGGIFKEKTLDNLRGKRFPKPAKEQFYFDSAQIFQLDEIEKQNIVKKAKSNLRTTPTAVLGKNLSVNLDTLYAKLGRGDGANLLILGANDRLQGERVLWNAVQSLYDCNKAIGQGARYYILPNISEDVDASAIDAHEKRLSIVKSLSNHPEVTLVDEDERMDTIEQVAATVRGRVHLSETNKKAVDALDAIYLIMPNQQMLSRNMGRRPKALDSLDNGLNITSSAPQPSGSAPMSSPEASIFEGLNMPGNEPAAPGFDAINFDSFGSSSSTVESGAVGNPGRDYDEELRYILEYGPAVNVHVLLQTTAPDKIYSGDTMREKEMGQLFNDIVLLKMMQASTMSLPVDSRIIEKLSAEPKSLRAVAYNGEREPRTIVPFDFK